MQFPATYISQRDKQRVHLKSGERAEIAKSQNNTIEHFHETYSMNWRERFVIMNYFNEIWEIFTT